MAHNRIIESTYDDYFGVARVTKSSQYGEFCRGAFCNPEYDEGNAWDGQKIAERRCDIDIQKAKAKDFQSRLKGMKHLQSVLHDKFNDDKDYYTIGMIEVLDELDHQVKIMEREVKKETDFSHYLQDNFNNYVNFLLETRKKTREKFNSLENKK